MKLSVGAGTGSTVPATLGTGDVGRDALEPTGSLEVGPIVIATGCGSELGPDALYGGTTE